MNIRKKLAVAAAIALPMSGLVVLGGAQVASAGGPPILSCASLGSDSGSTGGVTFDANGAGGLTGAGTAGLDLGAGLSASSVSSVDEDALAVGNNVVVLPNEAIAGQTLTLANSQVVTVVADSTAKIGVAGLKNFETAIISPAASSAIAKKTALTINPTTTSTYHTYNNTTVASGQSTVTATTADFTGDTGQPVTVAIADTYLGNPVQDSPFSPLASPASPAIVSSYISNVSPDGKTATISQYKAPTPGVLTDTTETINAVESGSVTVTVGQTSQATAGSVATDYDLALTGCASSLHTDAGVIYPNEVTITTPPGTGSTGPGSALALEASVLPIVGAQINFPSGLPAGYSWGGSENPTGYTAGGSGGYSSVTFSSLKDILNLASDTESFVGGSVTGPYSTPKASMSFGLGSVIVCTEAQLQAIGTGSGGSGIDSVAGPNHVPAAANAAAVGPTALAYCDGGPSSALATSVGVANAGGAAFGELSEIEAAPNAQAAGFDGTGLGEIYQAGGTGTAIL